MGFEQAVQVAVFNTLDADAPLSALITGIYDNVPQPDNAGNSAAFPYLVIGEGTFNEWDTDTEVGTDASIVIHSWSRYLGRKEVQQIQAAVYAALHRATLPVTGYAFVACDWVSSDTFVDADGLTRHGVQTFRVLLDEA